MKLEDKKYILQHFPDMSVQELARELGCKERKINKLLERAKEKGLIKPKREEKKKEVKKTKLIVVILSAALIVLLGAVVYTNSINGQFLLDDDLLITDNTFVKSFVHIPKLFTEDMGSGIGIQSSYFRPLQMLAYTVNYHFWKLNVQPYHIVNVLFHILMALSVYWMISVMFRSNMLALFTAAMFVVHPIHAESVSYVSGLGDCMVGFFTVLAFVLYIKQLDTKNPIVYVFLFVTYAVALFAKENSLVLPALFLLYHYAFKKRIKIYPFLILVGMTGVYLAYRMSFFKHRESAMSVVAILQRVPGFFVAMTEYVKVLFAPFGLYMGHDSQMFPITDPRAAIGGVIVLSLLIYGIKVRKSNRLVFFSIFWFFITLGPVSNLYPIAFFMADHYLYLPSIGFFLVLSKMLETVYKKAGIFRVYSLAIFIAFTGFLSYRQIQQNGYWSDAKKFYERTLKYNPGSPRMWSNLAKENIRRGNSDEAIKLYKRAIEIDPRFTNAHYNLGVVYNTLGRQEEAIASCKRAIEIEPRYTHAYNIIGVAYMNTGNNEEALRYFKTAVSTSPSNVIAICNLAVASSKAGDNEEAIRLLKGAIEANPDYVPSYTNLGYVYSLGGKKKEAVDAFEKAIEMSPKDVNAINNLGKLYFEGGQTDKAEETFKRALDLDPNNKQIKKNVEIVQRKREQERLAAPLRSSLQETGGIQAEAVVEKNNGG